MDFPRVPRKIYVNLDFSEIAKSFKDQISESGYSVHGINLDEYDRCKNMINTLIKRNILTKSEAKKACTRIINIINDAIVEK